MLKILIWVDSVMKDAYSVVKTLIRTEKGTTLQTLNKYLFCVANDANKIEIKKAIEEIFKVRVASVNTLFVRGKKKRVRYKEGMTPDWKKAIVSLKEGHKIEVS